MLICNQQASIYLALGGAQQISVVRMCERTQFKGPMSCCSGLSCCLRCWHLIWALNWAPAALFPVQLSVQVPEKTEEDSNRWAFATQIAWPWLLWPYEWANGWKISVSFKLINSSLKSKQNKKNIQRNQCSCIHSYGKFTQIPKTPDV